MTNFLGNILDNTQIVCSITNFNKNQTQMVMRAAHCSDAFQRVTAFIFYFEHMIYFWAERKVVLGCVSADSCVVIVSHLMLAVIFPASLFWGHSCTAAQNSIVFYALGDKVLNFATKMVIR